MAPQRLKNRTIRRFTVTAHASKTNLLPLSDSAHEITPTRTSDHAQRAGLRRWDCASGAGRTPTKMDSSDRTEDVLRAWSVPPPNGAFATAHPSFPNKGSRTLLDSPASFLPASLGTASSVCGAAAAAAAALAGEAARGGREWVSRDDV